MYSYGYSGSLRATSDNQLPIASRLLLHVSTVSFTSSHVPSLQLVVVLIMSLLLIAIVMLYKVGRTRAEGDVFVMEVLVLVFMKPWLVEAL